MRLQKDLREFIELLNSHEVDYIVVGAHAVAHHGYSRYTGDVVFFVRRTPQNVQKIDNLFICFVIRDLCTHAERLSGNNRLLRNINILINRRHAIVHQGDIASNGVVKAIGKNHILHKLTDTDKFVKACDTILNKIII